MGATSRRFESALPDHVKAVSKGADAKAYPGASNEDVEEALVEALRGLSPDALRRVLLGVDDEHGRGSREDADG